MTSISEERRFYEQVGFTHRLRGQWGARFDYTTIRSVDYPATRLFLHISVTNPDVYPSNDAHARGIEDIGISRFPNTGISYNELILPGGLPYEAQPMGRRGAHTVNDYQRSACTLTGCPSVGFSLTAPSWNLNYNSRACCMARNLDDAVTDADVDAAARWGAAGKLSGMVDKAARWHGHRCVANKDCPGGKAWARLDDIADLTADYLKQGDVSMALTDADIDKIGNMDISDLLTPEVGDAKTLKQVLALDRQRLYETKTALNGLVDDVDKLAQQVAEANAKLDALSLGGVTAETLAAIAKAVNDEIARRQQA